MSRALVLAAVLLPAPLAAAPVPVGPKAPDAPVPPATARLLKYRKVQKELNMTADQRITLIDALEDAEDDYEKKLVALDKNPDTPDEAYEKLDKERAKAVEKILSGVADQSLPPARRARLRQLGWRVQGPAAFADASLQKSLQMTAGQKKVAAELLERSESLAGRYLDSLGDETEDKVKADVVEFRKVEVKKFVEGMTAHQKDAWKALVGDAPAEFDADEMWFRLVEDEDSEPGS